MTEGGRSSIGGKNGRLCTAGEIAWDSAVEMKIVAMVNNSLGGGLIGDYRIAELGTAAMRAARTAADGAIDTRCLSPGACSSLRTPIRFC